MTIAVWNIDPITRGLKRDGPVFFIVEMGISEVWNIDPITRGLKRSNEMQLRAVKTATFGILTRLLGD